MLLKLPRYWRELWNLRNPKDTKARVDYKHNPKQLAVDKTHEKGAELHVEENAQFVLRLLALEIESATFSAISEKMGLPVDKPTIQRGNVTTPT